MENNQDFMSLFDYLGKPAGGDLGKQVREAASQNNQPVRVREISTPNYTGKVMLYTKGFLDSYFKPTDFFNTGSSESNELPF